MEVFHVRRLWEPSSVDLCIVSIASEFCALRVDRRVLSDEPVVEEIQDVLDWREMSENRGMVDSPVPYP